MPNLKCEVKYHFFNIIKSLKNSENENVRPVIFSTSLFFIVGYQ